MPVSTSATRFGQQLRQSNKAAVRHQRNEFLCLGRSAVPCFALHPNAEAITSQLHRPQDVCFLDGYVLVPRHSLRQEI